jgi:uncharacterized protein
MGLGAWSYVLTALAGIAAGGVNALAGGGTLISFPVLVGLGLPAVTANVTNIIALTPGTFAGAATQRADLSGQARLLRILVPLAAVGGLVGSIVLVHTSSSSFRRVVPYLLVFACVLLVAQHPVRARILRHGANRTPEGAEAPRLPLAASVLASGVYGGYFGAGLSIMFLAFLGLFSSESLLRLNAMKQALSFANGVAASIFLITVAHPSWGYVLVLALGSALGGIAGGRLVRVVPPGALRVVVVAVGLAVAIRYWV